MTTMGDDEVLEAITRGTYQTRHLDALFRVIEPALLGYVLAAAQEWRPYSGMPPGPWQRVFYPMNAACMLVGVDNDTALSDEYELADFKRWFDKPIDEDTVSRDRHSHTWDAHEGIVKRLFRKHGLENLRLAAKALSGASIENRETLIDQFVPRSDEARRERMSRVSAPLRACILWDYYPFPLLVLSPDADEFWYIADNTGQQWTALERRQGGFAEGLMQEVLRPKFANPNRTPSNHTT